MKLRVTMVAFLLCLTAGCTDTPDSLSREYRNAINEGIDAIMFINDEGSAKRMTERVLKPMTERFRALDFKMRIVRSNRVKDEFVKDMLSSDGVHLYLVEMEVNKQRLALERTRLRVLFADLAKAEESDEEAMKKYPALADLVRDGTELLEPLITQMTTPKMLEEMSNMPRWNVKGYDKAFADYAKRRKSFEPSEQIKLVD